MGQQIVLKHLVLGNFCTHPKVIFHWMNSTLNSMYLVRLCCWSFWLFIINSQCVFQFFCLLGGLLSIYETCFNFFLCCELHLFYCAFFNVPHVFCVCFNHCMFTLWHHKLFIIQPFIAFFAYKCPNFSLFLCKCFGNVGYFF
jgi:hypothetical protein